MFLVASAACLLGTIVTISQSSSPDKEVTLPSSFQVFTHLPLENSEEKIIKYIITTMAEKNLLQLGFEKKSLKRQGKKIGHIHPLRFAGFIFADPQLKQSMLKITKSKFKWKGFVRGFAGRMQEEAVKNNLVPYIEGFSEMLNVDSEVVTNYVENQDWEGLLRFLCS